MPLKRNYNSRSMTFLGLMVLFLASCQGGGDKVSWNALSVKSDGKGIARGTNSSGEQVLVYWAEIGQLAANANKGDSGGVTEFNADDFPITSSNATSVTRSGAVYSDGYTFSVKGVEDKSTSSDASGVYVETPGYTDMILVGGDKFTGAPSSGTYTYLGTQTSNHASEVAPNDLGIFEMSINFSTDSFSYTGQSGNTYVLGEGHVDDKNGRFATSDAQIYPNVSTGTYHYGTMHGMLHNYSKETTGLFHSNGSSNYSGSFIGSR
jgi:hypothetical protein